MDKEFITDIHDELVEESMRLGGISLDRLDFDLLGFSTTYTIDDGKTYNKLNEKELVLFDDDKLFLNEKLKIQQGYKIEIYQIKNKKPSYTMPKIRLIENKDITSLIADIDFNGVSFYPNIAIQTLQGIYKKMIKEGFFIGIRIFDFKKHLLEVLNKLKSGTLKHPQVKIEIASGIHPISPESEKLIICYKDKIPQADDSIQKVSIVGVKEGDLILRHIQPGTSRKGRNLKLAFIEPHLPPDNKIEFTCSENFEQKEICTIAERACYKEYYAKKRGFVTQSPDNKFEIENELNLASATFKETGAILGGLDNNITVNVKSNSDLEDAVGSGVHIECETILINGNVGSNTLLQAKNIKIYGNTNNSAKIYADNAYISTHRGYLKAKVADIDSLENGSIEAKMVKVKKSLGGKIEAKDVLVASLGSNNTINFNQIALIEKCSGTNNKFTAQVVEDENLFDALKAIEDKQREVPKLIEQLENAINSSKGGIDTLMKKIKNLQSQNLPVPPNFMQMVRDYKDYVSELGKLNAQKNELKIQKEELIKKLRLKDEELFEAKIINKDKVWKDMNMIKWKFSGSEYSYTLRRDEEVAMFFVKRYFDNNEIRIQVSNQYDEKDLEWLKQ